MQKKHEHGILAKEVMGVAKLYVNDQVARVAKFETRQQRVQAIDRFREEVKHLTKGKHKIEFIISLNL